MHDLFRTTLSPNIKTRTQAVRKVAMHSKSWYCRIVHISLLVASYDTHKSKQKLNFNTELMDTDRCWIQSCCCLIRSYSFN